MAGLEPPPGVATISVASHDTALCIIPPREAWPAVDRLRALYDKAYVKWPPHINLVYPFVQPDVLPRAAAALEKAVSNPQRDQPLRVALDSVDAFIHKHGNTIYLHDRNGECISQLASLRRSILESLGQKEDRYQMHMTIAQSEDAASDAHKFLAHKVSLLPTVEWKVDTLHILVRERLSVEGHATSQMKLWGTIDLSDGSLSRLGTPLSFYETEAAPLDADIGKIEQLQSRLSYYFEAETDTWVPNMPETAELVESPSTLTVASYNVLAEFEWPPSHARYPLIVKNILSRRATADVLVLQEVTDHFLSYLLKDSQIRGMYDFVSHGPPDQSDTEPLPSLLNLVILSKYPFEWEWVSFLRKHKGSLVARFSDIGNNEGDEFLPLLLATVHFSHGLTDGAVSAKKIEIQRILNYLQTTYPDNPYILAGDTNISTSCYSIEAALNKKAISNQSGKYVADFDRQFSDAGLVDAWEFMRSEMGEASDGDYEDDVVKEVFEGEQGATFDPTQNLLAAQIVGSGFNMRPQRYDRIMVRGAGTLRIKKFNKFGFLKEQVDGIPEPTYASDHWGVRCLLGVGKDEEAKEAATEVADLVVPVLLTKASGNLADVNDVKDVLSHLDVIPTEEDMEKRQRSFDALKQLIEGAFRSPAEVSARRPAIVTVPVGSYALGVWTGSSDIDCLCIGPFGTQTFFAVVAQQLRKSEADGFKILRRVRANTGTMLELDVQGVKMDLQYCPATSIAEQWPEVLRAPANHPVWTLSTQSLLKLKAVRDLDYLRRSIPDIVKFRFAHRFIKTWAKSRGLYSARFGYFGGIHISVLLARVCKLLARDYGSGSVSVTDILVTFFTHYAEFDWKNKMAFDPFFHRKMFQYTRTTREPLSILGYFPPSLNTSHAATLPSVRAISDEFKRAAALLASKGVSWASFLCGSSTTATTDALGTGASDFLTKYKSYVKIDAQFWGVSAMKGAQFIGWLESRCVLLMVDINRRLPGINARIWPARFVSTEDTGSNAEPGRDYQGNYLVGLDKLDPQMSREDLQLAFGSLQTVLRRFEELIRGDEKYFDAKSSWMSASVVNQAELGELKVDVREWGDYTPGDEESDDEEEEEAGVLDGESGAEWKEYVPLRKKHQKHPSADIVVPKIQPGKKFRTAADVMNRLRWDSELDSADYIVGYLDRFVGAMERPLDSWKVEQTDEEFIPQHRILWFKQKSTGKIMWERRTRKDEIFGSGVE